MRRLRFFKLPCLLAVLLVLAATAIASEHLVYVGTYTGKGSEGIYAYRFDPETGETSPVGLVAATRNPSFLAVDTKATSLYAVNEIARFHDEPTGSVSVFAIDRASARLTLLQEVASLGQDPAYLSLDKSDRYLMVANYDAVNHAGGSYAVFPIGPDGRLGSHTAFVRDSGSSVNRVRQAGPHPHSIQPTIDNRFVIVADLGLDKLFVHRFDARTGSLTPASPRFVSADPGVGPRHVALAPSGRFVYVVNELASTVTVFACGPGAGTLHLKQTVSSLLEACAVTNTAAEISVDPRGRFLYVSNRGDDSIVIFGIDPEHGTLTAVQRVPSGGRTPRSFAIDPTGRWLFAANQDSNAVALFQIDPQSGRLTATSRSLKVVSAVCVLIVASE